MGDIVTGETRVNLNTGPIICEVRTDHPLPPVAWRTIGNLAYAIEDAAAQLANHVPSGDS